MLRPVASIGQLALKELTAKNLILLVLGAAAWHTSDVGAVKDVHAEVSTLRQQNFDQEKRLDTQRDANMKKVDKDTYDRDFKVVYDSLNRLQSSVDDIRRLQVEQALQGGHR